MIFLTGFPGFITSRLIRRLIEKNSNESFVCLVEPRMYPLAKKEGERIAPGKIKIIEGDITQVNLGLLQNDLDYLIKEVDQVFHLAAIYDLTVGETIAFKVNVEGTGHVLDFVKKLKNLKCFGYFSTCYVAGLREGKVYEEELEKGQKFKNFYESTKYQAEVLVRQRLGEIPTIIFRPSVVVGDSKTGEIPKFDGPYFALELIQRLRRLKIPVMHVGPSQTPFNIVPVDFVVNAATEIFYHPKAIGLTYQLADPYPPASGEILETFCQLWDQSYVKGHMPVWLAKFFWKYLFFEKITGVPREALAYFNYGIYFDTTNTQKYLAPPSLSCPLFKEYAPMMVSYFRRSIIPTSFQS